MFRIYEYGSRFSVTLSILRRLYCSGNDLVDVSNPAKKVYDIMMTCPKLGLENALNESGIRISTELIEEILNKFENAGMQAYRFFEWAEKQRNYSHSIKAYHIIIGSLAKIRQYQIMWDLVNAMRNKGILNIETFCVIMRKYARAKKVDEAIYTFNVMDKFGVTPNSAAFNGLLSALCKSKNVRKAQEVFNEMKDRFIPDSKTYSILLEGWGKEPNLPKARQIFREMVENGCDPDAVTYGIMVDTLCKAGRIDEAVIIVKDMGRKGCKPTSFIYSILVHTYGTENRIGDAVNAFLEMESQGIQPDVVVYNALISAFCKMNGIKNVYRVLDDMNRKSIQPNSRTCNIILNTLINTGETDQAFKSFKWMIKRCEPDSDTYTMIIKMFCENDKLDMALKVWKFMKKKQFVPSMHTFSVMINGLCDQGEVNKACVLLEEMIEKGIRPSGTTFGRLRHLLLKEGRKDVLEFLTDKMNILIKEPLCD